MDIPLTPAVLISAYRSGIFPMGIPETDVVQWFSPDPRGVIPLDGFHVPSTLAQQVRQERFAITADLAFGEVIRRCADREQTWITPPIIDAYIDLHEKGAAHSVEAWREGELAGGLYGVAIGGAFFGESMFFEVSNASKIALVHLVRQMRRGGYTLLDTQYSNPHLEQFGAVEIPREEYLEKLKQAIVQEVTWWPESGSDAILGDATHAPETTPSSR